MSRRSRRTVLALIAVCCLGQPFTHAIKAQVTFATAADLTAIGGSQPLGGLVRGADGALYGTTAGGGAESCGIIYRLTTDGILSLVHSFTRSHGCYPVGELTLGPDGSLYGVTYYGGDTHITFFPGLGTVFKVLPNGTGLGTFTLLRSFPGAPGGTNPYGTLTLAPNGLLYGTATGGSIAGGGLIFTIDPQLPEPDNFAIVANGLNSQAALTLGLDGFLYGTTWIGNFSAGTVFRMPLNGAPETLYSFPFVPNANPQICPEGAQPLGELIEAADGHFYGSTSTCGPDPDDAGTIFRITPAGDLTTLHAFSEGASPGVYPGGAAPWGGMTLGADGNLYGATTAGGDSGNGILYRVTPGATPSFEILRSFSGLDGQGPQEGRLLEVSPGVFYGTSGGGPGGSGQVFKLSLDVNSAPVAQNGTIATIEDVAVNGTLTASDIDDDPITFTIVTNGTLGTAVVTDAATGAFTYTPNANVSGTDTFTFKGNDGTVDSNVATVTVTITPINDPPVANDASITTTENTPISGTLSASDADGQALTFSILSNGTRGTPVITDSATGAFTYTPNANVSGADSFTFQASDGFVTSNVATVSVTITAVNLAPVARSRMMATTAGTTAPGTLVVVDAEGDALTFSVAAPASHGIATLTDATTGDFTYTPGPGFFGFDSFTFQVSDGTSSATASQMVLVGAGAPQWPGQTVRASVHNTGAQATTGSACPSASADGRFVAFNSLAALVDGDTNGAGDVFLHDRLTSTTTRVSVGTGGTQGNGNSQCGLVSANGRFVVFESAASNLVAGDTNGGFDLFRHDRETGQTVRVNVASGGVQVSALTQTGGIASVSADGRRIAFSAFVGNLVPGDTNGAFDVFVHDADTLETVRISVANDGTQGSANSLWPAMSGDGRYVAFESAATNLVAGDTNGAADIFVRDLELGQTFRVSLTASGGQAGGSSQTPKMPLVGGIVMFQSFATNLVPGVTASGQLYARDFTAGTTSAISLPNGGGTPNSSARFALLGSPVSADGRFVTFLSFASNLVAGDTNGAVDVFIRDRVAGTTARVSVSGGGAQALDTSFDASMSADGRFAVLSAAAANLVTGDTNAASDVFAVGGVSVTPAFANAPAAGATGVVDVTFAYPGTVWAATSNVPWLTISSQSSTNSSGTVGYTIAPNTSGTPRTGTLTVATQTVTVTQGASTAPVAQDGMLAATEDTAATGTLVAVDPNGDTLTYAIVNNGTLGTVVVTNATTGAFTYTPSLNMNGTDSFTFQASDGTTTSSIATVQVTVAPVNDAPVAANGALTTAEDTAASGLLASADVDGPSATYAIVSNGTRGVAAITNAATGAYTYTPNANANGTDSFSFQVSDGSLTSNPATVSITITAVNDGPDAVPGAVATTENTPVSGHLVSSDPEADAVTYSLTSQPPLGVVSLTDPATGAFTFTPAAGASGYGAFTFTVQDAGGVANSGTHMVFVVAGSPRWPGQTVRASLSSAGGQGTADSFDATFSADGRYVAFTSDSSQLVAGDTNNRGDVFVRDRLTSQTTRVSVATNGTQANQSSIYSAISADGRFVAFSSSATNLVAGDTNGVADTFVHDRATGVTARVSVATDGTPGNGASGQETFSGPVVSADGRFVAFGSDASNLVPGDTNNARDIFVHDRNTGRTARVSVATGGAQGSGLSHHPAISPDGRFVTFGSAAPNLVAGDSNSRDDVFVHDRLDGVTTRVSVNSAGVQANQASALSQLSADGRYVAFRSPATNLTPGDTNATDDIFVHDRLSGQTTRVSVASDGTAANGTSDRPFLSADGRYVAFTSRASTLVPGDANGQWDAFVHDRATARTYRVGVASDGTPALGEAFSSSLGISADGRFVGFQSGTALVVDDTNAVRDIFVVGGVSVNPTSATMPFAGAFGAVSVDFVYPGTAWTAASGAPWIAVTSQSSTNSNGTVDYTVEANPGGTSRVGMLTVAAQTVTVTQAASTAPVAQDAAIAVSEDTSAAGTLVAVDPNGDTLSYTVVASGTLGTAVVTNATTGAFTYTPQPNLHGTDSFTFQASDGATTSNVATVVVTIAPVNDAPVAANGALTTAEDAAASGVLAAADVDGPAPTFTVVANGTRGSAAITDAATGAFTYTPNADATGTDTFTFKASDGTLDSNVATVMVTITPVNDAPVASNTSLTTPEDTPLAGTLPVTDVDGPSLVYAIVANGTKGTAVVTNTATGAFTYTPSTNLAGSDTVTFVVSDGALQSNVGTVTITITPVDDAPFAQGRSVRVLEDRPQAIKLFGMDVEGQTLSFAIATPPTHGALTGTAPDVTYTPDANYNGADSFTFTVSDGVAESQPATIGLTISSAFWDTGGPEGGNVSVIVTDPAFPGVVYASGFHASFKSVDAGLTWFPIGADVGILTRVLAIDPFVPTTIYMSASGRLYRSADGGATFVTATTGLPANSFVFTVTATSAPGVLFAMSSGNVFRTVNGSATWTLASTGIPDGTVSALAADPRNANIVYAATSGGIYKTVDAGGTWSLSSTGLVGVPNSIVVNPQTPTTVYAPTQSNGVFRSIDGGASWAAYNTGVSFPGYSTLTVDSSNPTTLYLTNGFQAFKRTEGQASWTTLTVVNDQLATIKADPLQPGVVYAGTQGHGVFRTSTFGTAWAARNTGLTNAIAYALARDPANAATAYAGTYYGGVMKTVDGAASWFNPADQISGTRALAVHPTTPGIVYAGGTCDGVRKSTNGGTSWTSASTGLSPACVVSLAMDPATPSTIYAGVSGNGTNAAVFKSTNDAASWSPSSTGLPNATLLAVVMDPQNPSTLYAATANGLYVTNDGGTGWSATQVSGSVTAVAVSPTPGTSTIYAAGIVGLQRNSGSGWTTVLSQPGISAIAVMPDDPAVVYAATQTTIWRSADAGGTWRSLTTAGLPQLNVNALLPGSPLLIANVSSVFALQQAANDAPVAQGGTLAVIEDTPQAGSLVANDIDGDSLTYAVVANGAKGSAVVTNPATGAYTYTPNANATGSDTFTFRVNDGTTDSNIATVTVTITPVNDAPLASESAVTTDENVPVSGTLVASDVDSPTLSFGIVTNGSRGTATVTNAATGAFTYTPSSGQAGTDTFTFQVSDGALVSNIATVSVTIDDVTETLAVNLVAPNGGERVFANVPTVIRWTSTGAATSFDVELSRNSGATFTPIAACTALPGSATSCIWTPAGPNSSTARIRVTARNGSNTATDASDADFTISTTTPSVTVTRPNTALSLVIGSADSIRWNHNLGLQSFVRVELSRNGGVSWELLAASFQNTGATSSIFPWVVTGPVSSSALARVTWLDGPASDVSNVTFSIVRPTVTVTAPNTAVAWTVGTPRAITWTHNMASGQVVNLDVSRDGGVTWNSIATSVANATATTGTFDWVVTGPATPTARVRVSWASDTAANDASNVNFSIVAPSITVTAPNTAVTWRAGNTQTLRFTHNLGTGQPVAFDVSRDGGSTWTPIISLTTTTSNAVTYAWVVSGPPTPLARIRARWTSDPGVFDVSDVNFAIISRITVTAPNTAVTWGAGSTRQVTWTHNLGLAETVNIDVSPDGGATWVNVAAGVANATATSGSFAALMPGSVTTQALVRVSQTTDPTSFDTSDVQFTLAAPVITVTAPNTNVNWPIGSTRSISWSHNLGTGEAVEVALSRDNGATWAPLTSALANTGNTTGTFSWVVTGPATTTGRVRVTWMRNGAVQDVSNVAFRIQ